MKKIYVAHPFNAEEKNKKSVEAIIKSLVERDPTTLYISPIHATGYFYKDVSYEQGMEYCYELLRHCDELLLCRGWEESRGCNLEKAYAENHNIPIRFHWDTPEIEKEEEFRVPTSFGDLVVTRGTKNCPVLVHLDNNGDTYTILRVEDAVKITGEPDLRTVCNTETQDPIIRIAYHNILERMQDEALNDVYHKILERIKDRMVAERYSTEMMRDFTERFNDEELRRIFTSQNAERMSSEIFSNLNLEEKRG